MSLLGMLRSLAAACWLGLRAVTGCMHAVQASGEAAAAADAQAGARLAGAQACMSAMMEDVIAAMAGHVPLGAIAERILASHARDPFGDFKARARLRLTRRPAPLSLPFRCPP